MFRVVFHPSSGAHNTVSTVSGTNETCDAVCRQRGWTVTSSRSATLTTGSITGLISARYCGYSVTSSWWWVKYHPKHVEQLTNLNKLYSVASCWIIISKKVRLWELRYLSGDKDEESDWFVTTPYNLRTFRTTGCLFFHVGKETTRKLDYRNPDMTFAFKFVFKPLKAKRRPLYLKPQSVPRCKHFPSRL